MSQKIGKSGMAFAKLWHHVDLAQDKRTLGRLASEIAIILMGKHKPVYHNTEDYGDYVVATNCSYLRTTGNKLAQKTYGSHSGKPGHLKLVTMQDLRDNKGAGEILRKAVSGMLPKNKHRKWRLARLRVFDGSEHPYKQNLTAFADEYQEVERKRLNLANYEKLLQEARQVD